MARAGTGRAAHGEQHLARGLEATFDRAEGALEGPLRGVFREVVFAVLGDANRAAFEQRFTGSGGVTP